MSIGCYASGKPYLNVPVTHAGSVKTEITTTSTGPHLYHAVGFKSPEKLFKFPLATYLH